MNLTLSNLCRYLEEFLEPKKITDGCLNGLQIEGKSEISSLATAVSASLFAIERAVELNVDALIVHHGIFWNKESSLIAGIKKKKIALLLKHQISLIAYHLPLDMHPLVGNNWRAAEELYWNQLEPFGLYNGLSIGVKGSFREMPVLSFSEQLESYYRHPVTAVLGGKNLVKSAALISGGAHREIQQAVDAEVDCFITGSYDEPVWHIAKEEGINFFALGHFSTEKVGPRALGSHLQHVLQIPVSFIDEDNPF